LKLPPDLQDATFVERLNRFAARLVCDGREVTAHLANSGRLEELLRPENPMFLSPAPDGTDRKTAFDLVLIEVGGTLVSADARLPNRLLKEAIESDRVPEFAGYESVRQEVSFGESRIDLMLSGTQGLCYIEIKSVTLVDEGVGLFPDAPTERGRKHMRSLKTAVQQGHRAAAVFVIQRADAHALTSNRPADPAFCDALQDAVAHGVEAYAYRCQVSRRRIDLSGRVQVRLA